MKGKDKCKILKEIRAQIAAANDIEWVTSNCSHKGECRGTCPKCESEVAALERALNRRRALGKSVVLAGISASMILSTTSCEALLYEFGPESNAHSGKMPAESTKAQTDIQVDGDIMPPSGEPIAWYPRSSEFTPCQEKLYRASESIIVDWISDEDYSDTTIWEISANNTFTLAGSSEELEMLMIRYNGKLYCINTDQLSKAEEVAAFPSSSFTSCDMHRFKVITTVYFSPLTEQEYPSNAVFFAEPGESFALYGKNETDSLLLIEFNGLYYCLHSSFLNNTLDITERPT